MTQSSGNNNKRWAVYQLHKIMRIVHMYDDEPNEFQQSARTRSPISVMSLPGRMSRSCFRAHASSSYWYFVSSRDLEKRMLSFSVRFCIQACCGTYARLPWNPTAIVTSHNGHTTMYPVHAFARTAHCLSAKTLQENCHKLANIIDVVMSKWIFCVQVQGQTQITVFEI